MKIVKWCEKHFDEVGGPSFSHFISDLGLTGTWSKSYDSEKLSLPLWSRQPSVPPLHTSNQAVLLVMRARGDVKAKMIMCKMPPPKKRFPICHHITAGVWSAVVAPLLRNIVVVLQWRKLHQSERNFPPKQPQWLHPTRYIKPPSHSQWREGKKGWSV